jgi:hypothetical protein
LLSLAIQYVREKRNEGIYTHQGAGTVTWNAYARIYWLVQSQYLLERS